MTEAVWVQLIITIGAIGAAMFATVRYAILQSNKEKKGFLDYLEKMQAQQLEYYEIKNGHLERISKDFTKTINKNTKAIEKLTASKKR
jgi:hypothetical protein